MIFREPQFEELFKPVFGGMVVKLSPEATKAIVSHYRGNKSQRGKLFIMLTYEGDLDPNWPYEHEWNRVERRVKEETLLVYNTTKKHCSRPVWHAPLDQRTEWNCAWERVRLIPVAREVNAGNLPPWAKIFNN